MSRTVMLLLTYISLVNQEAGFFCIQVNCRGEQDKFRVSSELTFNYVDIEQIA